MMEIVLVGAVRRSFGTDQSRFVLDTETPVSVREALSLAGLDLSKARTDRILVLREGSSSRLSRALDTETVGDGEKITLANMIQGG